jgi:phage terminase large subunit-like protein
MARMNDYVRGVVSGQISACLEVRQACQRHLDDLERSKGDWPYRFDDGNAGRACAFMEKLPHVKGEWARKDGDGRTQRLIMQPWQCFIIGSLFGWVKKADSMRRFRRASIYVPRKNGKSIFGAGIGLRMFAFDGEPGAEVYSGATTRKQAMEVFRPAKQMCRKEPDMVALKAITINAESLIREEDGSRMEPVIGKPGDGASPHCSIADEYHEHQTDELVSTMETGMGARKQPLSVRISTAGANLAGPCREDWKACQNLLARKFVDDTHFAIIYTIDKGDAWDSDAAMIKANPNYDVSVYGDFLRAERDKASRDPRAQAAYKTKHLNLWVNAKAGMFNLQQWALLKEDTGRFITPGARCFAGLDMMMKHDICALPLLFPVESERFAIKAFYFLPRETIQQPQMQHYRAWVDAGHIIEAGEFVIDHEVIRTKILELRAQYQIESLEYDPAHTLGFVSPLAAEGITCVDAYAGGRMPEHVRDFDAMIRSGRMIHDGDPVLEWAISNCVEKPSRRGMPMLDKESNDQKIDPVVALVMALGGAKRAMETNTAGPGIMFFNK